MIDDQRMPASRASMPTGCVRNASTSNVLSLLTNVNGLDGRDLDSGQSLARSRSVSCRGRGAASQDRAARGRRARNA